MMTTIAYFSTILLLLSLVTGQSSGQCTSTKQLACTSKFDGLQRLFAASSLFTEQQLNSACSALDDVSRCITDAGCSDSDPKTLSWAFQKNAFTYVCGEGRAAFLRNQDCFGNYSGIILTGGCKPYSTAPGNVCQSFNVMLSCIRATVTNLCNTDASDFFATYIAAQTEPMVLRLAPDCVLLVSSESTFAPKLVEMSTPVPVKIAKKTVIITSPTIPVAGLVLIPVCFVIGLAIVGLALYYCCRQKPVVKDKVALLPEPTEDEWKTKTTPIFKKTSFAPRFYVKNRQIQS